MFSGREVEGEPPVAALGGEEFAFGRNEIVEVGFAIVGRLDRRVRCKHAGR
jgi:hypothetical protein